MSDKLKPGMLTYDDSEEPEALEFPIERHSLIKGDPFKGRKSAIFVDGHKIGEGIIESVSYEPDDEPDEVPPPREPGEWQPPTVTAHATIKASKAEVRRFRRQYMKKTRLPRKLKKAMCHMAVFNENPKINTRSLQSDEVTFELGYWIGTKNHYPRTKWVRKAYYHFYRAYKRWNEYVIKKMLTASCPERSPEIVITKEQQSVLQEMIKSSIH